MGNNYIKELSDDLLKVLRYRGKGKIIGKYRHYRAIIPIRSRPRFDLYVVLILLIMFAYLSFYLSFIVFNTYHAELFSENV